MVKPDATVAQKVVRMDAVNVAVMASVAAETAAAADAAVAKAVAQKAVPKAVLTVVVKIETTAVMKVVTMAAAKAVVASGASAALKRVLKAYARNVKTALLVTSEAMRRAVKAGQTHQFELMDNNATKAAPTTVNHVSHVLRARAVSAPAASVVTALNVVTARHAMLQSKISRWPTRPPWRRPCVVMALSKRKSVPRRKLAATRAAVSVVNAMVVVTIVAVNALKATTRALSEMLHSTLKPSCPHHCQQRRQTATRPLRLRLASMLKSNVNPGNAAAVTVTAATAVNVVMALTATTQAMRVKRLSIAALRLLIQSLNRRRLSKNAFKMPLNL